jgi:MraZ protein
MLSQYYPGIYRGEVKHGAGFRVSAGGRDKAVLGTKMALLVGRHVNRIDKKGRVSVPKPFRDYFRDKGFAGLYAFPLFKYPAIEACGEDIMQRLNDSLEEIDMFSDDQDDLNTVILENAHSLPFDAEGRMVLPKDLMEGAGITDQVLFVGVGSRIRIWDPETYTEHRGPAVERLRKRGATLKLRPATSSEEGGA